MRRTSAGGTEAPQALLKAQDFFEFAFDGPLSLPAHLAQFGVKHRFVQKPHEITLAGRRRAKAIGRVEADIRGEKFAAKCEAG